MAWETAEPPGPNRSQPAPSEGVERAGDGREQHFGPLAIERREKDDGRALILYRRSGAGGQ